MALTQTSSWLPHTMRWLINGFGFLGGFFIVYGSISVATGQFWPPLERIAIPLSSSLTLLGTITTAASVFFYRPTVTPPEPMSFVVAPIVILASLFALAMVWWAGLPTTVVNGFAIVGMAGALLRIQPNPYFKALS